MSVAPPDTRHGSAPFGASAAPVAPAAPGTVPLRTPGSTTPARERRRSLVTTPDLTPADRQAMRRAGLPWRASRSDRFWFSPVTLLVPLLLIGFTACGAYLWVTVVPDRTIGGSQIQGTGVEAIVKGNQYALLTAVPLALVFVLADRFRTQTFLPRLGIWAITFAWGALAATGFSMWLNSWMAQWLGIAGQGDPATGDRAAVFVAPFVEEFAKATVLFWIAILARNRWVSRLGAVTLAGLSATAFAYVENIVYYARIYRYAATNSVGVTPEEAIQFLVVRRGLAGFFAHPLFTIMTVLGLALALRSRSKLVRVMAPLCGFLGAALLHMAWNGFATTMPNPMPLYFFIAIPLAIAVAVMTIRQVRAQARLVEHRLGDYVLAGWLSQSDQQVISSPRRRLATLWSAMFAHPVTAVAGPIAVILGPPLLLAVWLFAWPWWLEGLVIIVVPAAMLVSLLCPTPWRATLSWLRTGTELAYLRDSITKGLIDQAGQAREGELFGELESLRDQGVEPVPTGRVKYPWVWLSEALRPRTTSARPAVGSTVGQWPPPGR